MTKRIFTKIEDPILKVVNTETGEIKSGVATVKCDTIDEFIMCFLNSINEIMQLDGNTMRVLMWCWKFSSFNVNLPQANVITNDLAFKKNIRDSGGDLSDSVINKCIHNLKKCDMLIPRCKGSYFLNPVYFFRGNIANRSKLKYTISFNNENDDIVQTDMKVSE